jgi:hypothetical protein
VLADEVGVVGGAVGAGEDEPGGGVGQAGGEGVGDLASPVRGEVGGGARVQGDSAVSAPGLGFAFDDPVADVDVLAADGETPDGQVDLGPAQRNGLPAAQPGVGDKPVRGYSSDRTSLRSWRHCILALVCTTRGQPVSSGRGSAPMRTVWTIWTGCAGLMGSCVRAAATPAAGRSPTADTDARRVVAGPRSRPGRCSTAAGRR